jgi:hypothetical protein
MKIIIPLLFCILLAQESYEGEITFDYTGTENGFFTSIIQDSIVTGFAYNQMGLDTSYVIMMSITEQENNEFDLFLAVLQDTTFPVQPRTWNIPGQGNLEDPLSLESIVIFIPELDSVFVLDLIETLTDTTGGDSLALDSLFESLFFELIDIIYLGIAGVIEISALTDSTVFGGFYATMWKPLFSFIDINNGEFNFTKVPLPDLSIKSRPAIPEMVTVYPAYPNPFNPSTTVRFSVLDTKQPLSLHIYDIDGRLIETLFSGYVMLGFHEVQWNARQHPSGVYFAVLQSGHIMQSTKLILIK